jgi:hypothetical protein
MRRLTHRLPTALLTGLLIAALGAPATALAQGATRDDFIASPGAGQWSANDFLGLSVHNGEGEELGPVVDVLIGGEGRDAYVVFETGGFLGSGEKLIAAPLRAFHITASAPGREERTTAGAVVGTELPPENAQSGADLTGGSAAPGLKPLFLELRVSADDLALAPPFGSDPKRIPAVAP